MWPASIQIGMLNLTVLAVLGDPITYLLEIGFSLESITVCEGEWGDYGVEWNVITPALLWRS